MKQKKKFFILQLLFLFLLLNVDTDAQNSCSPNIGFEEGTFANWNCFSGIIDKDGALNILPVDPIAGTHSMLKNGYPQEKDPFGGFPVNCPNGSGYSIQLGNSLTQNHAERVEYTFTVPANQNDYSIIYNYAVVLQNPSHSAFQQPKFTAKVFDVAENKYLECGSFEFIASPNLPGFKLSTVSADVFYKTWSPITINLYGYAGKMIRLEFTTNDCTQGGHFGYAYIDVNENCSSPISGNVYCAGAQSLTLTAPFGFKEYRWYNADFTSVLGTENILKISPPPPTGTKYVLEILPFPGQGCADTLNTIINSSPEIFDLKVKDSLEGCSNTGVNLTLPSVTAGSTEGIRYSYFMDINQLNYVPTPTVVTTSANYFIKGANTVGCNDIKPVKVIISPPPAMVVKSPAPVCFPSLVDLTSPAVSAGSEPGLSYSYWKNAAATIPIATPTAVSENGTYFIKGTNRIGCTDIKTVEVTVVNPPSLMVTNAAACGSVDITTTAVRTSATTDAEFTYWTDAAATIPLTTPEAITTSGTYYIKSANSDGCFTVKPVQVTISSYPAFTVTNPAPVNYPATVNIVSTISGPPGITYSYWTDPLATKPLARPTMVGVDGIYYIKAVNSIGCSIIKPVSVIIIPPPEANLVVPNAFSPNNDGVNDLFKIEVVGVIFTNHITIFNRSGQQVFVTKNLTNYWDGTTDGKPLPFGTYYWVYEGLDTFRNKKVTKSGSVTLIR